MTSRNTWKNAERTIAQFHNPEDGRRTPLSGINSGHTHADCMGVDGMFIEVKYRKTFSLYTLYTETKKLAKKEAKVPVVSIREKGKQGFIDMIHSEYLDTYVQMYIRNRCLEVDSTRNVMFGETILTKFFTGAPIQVDFLLKKLTHKSFKGDGTLVDRWWDRPGGRPLTVHLRLSEGFGIVLYGTFNHPMQVDPIILSSEVTEAMGVVISEATST